MGQVVQSRAGRDVGKAYVVVGFVGEKVLLANGETRPLAQPKPKNLRHINPTKTILSAAETATDTELKKALAAWLAGSGAQTQT